MVHAINAAVVTVCVARVLLVEHPCRLPSHSVVAVAVTRAYAHAVNRSTTTEWRMYLFLHAEVHADLLRDAHTEVCANEATAKAFNVPPSSLKFDGVLIFTDVVPVVDVRCARAGYGCSHCTSCFKL